MDLKRLLYLFGLALAIGLAVIHLRTSHLQAVYQLTSLAQQQQQVRQQIRRQQVRVSQETASPEQLKKSIEKLQVQLCPPGTSAEQVDQLARR